MNSKNYQGASTLIEEKRAGILAQFAAIKAIRPFVIDRSFLGTFETIIVPVTSDIWMPLALSGVIKPLNRRKLELKGIPADLKLSAAGPVTGYLFTTTAGRHGLLAFARIARNPCSVTLHYKWAADGHGSISKNAALPLHAAAPIRMFPKPRCAV